MWQMWQQRYIKKKTAIIEFRKEENSKERIQGTVILMPVKSKFVPNKCIRFLIPIFKFHLMTFECRGNTDAKQNTKIE